MNLSPLLMALSLLPPIISIRRHGYDFDVIDAYYLYPDGVAAALLGSFFKRPVVLTALGTDVNLIPNDAIARRQIVWSVRRAVSVTAVCKALKGRLVQLGAHDSKVAVVEHGVDPNMFQPLDNREQMREDLGIKGPTLISVGQLIARKGHGLVIEALKGISGVELMIVGSGPEERKLRRQVKKLNLTHQVRFLGQLNQKNLSEYMGAADALVLCSSREGIANVLLEAMSCGTPVVATAIWGTPEVVNSPEAGVLVHGRTAAALRDGIVALLQNPPCRSATRLHAAQFSWKTTAALHAGLLLQSAHGSHSFVEKSSDKD